MRNSLLWEVWNLKLYRCHIILYFCVNFFKRKCFMTLHLELFPVFTNSHETWTHLEFSAGLYWLLFHFSDARIPWKLKNLRNCWTFVCTGWTMCNWSIYTYWCYRAGTMILSNKLLRRGLDVWVWVLDVIRLS